ncbi:MAG: flagellar protein FlaG [Alphaproteobacteria bacterium]
MIGPVGNSPSSTEPIRQPTDRIRTEPPDIRSGGDAQTRAEASNEAARINSAAIVPEAAELANALKPAAGEAPYLRIEQDQGTGRFVYKSVDTKTGEVVKEWPEEEMRRALQRLGELRGFLVDETA